MYKDLVIQNKKHLLIAIEGMSHKPLIKVYAFLGIPEVQRRNEQNIEFISIPFSHGSEFQQIHNLDGLTFNYE